MQRSLHLNSREHGNSRERIVVPGGAKGCFREVSVRSWQEALAVVNKVINNVPTF